MKIIAFEEWKEPIENYKGKWTEPMWSVGHHKKGPTYTLWESQNEKAEGRENIWKKHWPKTQNKWKRLNKLQDQLRLIPRHMVIKLLKDRILKARENWLITCRAFVCMSNNVSRFLFRNLGGWKAVDWYIQSAERKQLSTKNAVLSKLSFQSEGGIKTFPDKQKPSFVTTRPALQEMLKGVLQRETKGHRPSLKAIRRDLDQGKYIGDRKSS